MTKKFSIYKMIKSESSYQWIKKLWMIGFFVIFGFSQVKWFAFKHVEIAIIATVLLLTALYAFVETGERMGILIGGIFTTVILGVVVNYYFLLGIISYILRLGKWI